MPRYELTVHGRGRGTRKTAITASNLAAIRRAASRWLEYGTTVEVYHKGKFLGSFKTTA